MTDRWSPLDRAIYGAEDDEDMDMILDHLDRAANATEADGTKLRPRRPERRRAHDNAGES